MLAIAQPLFDQFGRNPTFFVAHRSSSTTIWLLLLGLFVIPGAIAAALSLGLAAVHRRAGWWLHCALIGLLGALVVVPVFNRAFGQRTWASVAAGLLVVIGLTALYASQKRVRPFFGYMGAFTVVILGLFVFNSGVTSLLFEEYVPAIGAGGNDSSVVLIVFDELPLASLLDANHQLDSSRAPNLAAFADESATWYRDTTTTSWATVWAVSSMLSGQRSTEDSLPTAAQYPQNLFTATAPSHELLVAESVTRLCPTSVCGDRVIEPTDSHNSASLLRDSRVLYLHTLLPERLADRWLPSIDNGWTGFGGEGASGDEVASYESDLPDSVEQGSTSDDSLHWFRPDLEADQPSRVDAFVDALADNVGPTVSYGHFLIPHAPWSNFPDGTRYNGSTLPGRATGGRKWGEHQGLIDAAIQRHLLQVGYADAILGRVIEQLRATGQYDNSMIIVTSDHGAAFLANAPRRLTHRKTVSDLAMVPLLIKSPDQTEGKIDDTPAELIDVFPTIADELAIDLAEPMDGQSLTDPERVDAERSMMRRESIVDFDPTGGLDDAIARITRVVPTGTPAMESFGTTSTRDLIGTPVDSLTLGTAADFGLKVKQPLPYSNIDLSSGFVPALLRAEADRTVAADTTVAVALGGRIAGAGDVVGGELYVLLDPTLMTNGDNEITAYVVSDGALSPIAVDSGVRYDIESSEGSVSKIVREDETWDRADDDRYVGAANFPPSEERFLRVAGWTADGETGASAVRIILVDGDVVIAQHPSRTERPDVVDVAGDERFLDSGFSFDLTIETASSELTVIALYPDGEFYEMVVEQPTSG